MYSTYTVVLKLEYLNGLSCNTAYKEKENPIHVKTLEERMGDPRYGGRVATRCGVLVASHGCHYAICGGLSSVSALLKMKELWQENPRVSPCGEPWPSELVGIFTEGLPVQVWKYTEAEAKGQREG